VLFEDFCGLGAFVDSQIVEDYDVAFAKSGGENTLSRYTQLCKARATQTPKQREGRAFSPTFQPIQQA
jgi:hypothetical protein